MPGAELLDGGGVDCGILSAVLFFAPYRLPKFFLNTRRFKSKKGERVEEAGQVSCGEAALHGTQMSFLSLHGGIVFTDAGLLVPVSMLPVSSGNLGFLTVWKCIFPFTLGET